jgi:prepilin-type N-terminal cleavage/methylation domain-containing protein
MIKKKGQTLIELMVAIGIFAIAIGSLAFFILESYGSGRLAREMTIANFLAEEGLEAARSIRDNSWDDLSLGSHGLAIFQNKWIFQGSQEDVSNQLKGGVRRIIVENIGSDRKKVTSRVSWQFTPDRIQNISLVTYLTNWQKLTPPYLVQTHYRWRYDNGGE